MSGVQQALNEFTEEAITYRLLKGVYSAVPYSPDFALWTTVDDAVLALKPHATPEELERARQIAESDQSVANVIWMARALDAADRTYAAATGLFAAWKLIKGESADSALETDNQQRNDAVLKALGIAYMVYHAYPGSIQEKAVAFRDSPTGQAMMMYYGTIEVALPFADNVAMGAGNALSNLLQTQGGEQASRLAGMAKGHSLEGAVEMLGQLADRMQKVATHAQGYIGPVTEQVGQYVPGAMGMADKAAGALANAADAMPVYRLLGSRLAAEAAARRALSGTA